MDTREFLRRYAYVYLYVAAFFLLGAGLLRHSVEVSSDQRFPERRVIIIDAGHGGPDGGTTGVAGTGEAELNLQIARRLERLLTLFGCDTVMTRKDSGSLASEGDTIRQKKQSDLRNRVEMVNAVPNGILVSIHQNHFPDGRYYGPQVFYSGEAKSLAEMMQASLTHALAPGSRRAAKEARGIYLMEHIQCPGILVECGFLSNADEEQRLRSAEHQKRLAAVMAAILAGYAGQSVV